jgi:hypothetical protein
MPFEVKDTLSRKRREIGNRFAPKNVLEYIAVARSCHMDILVIAEK